MKSNINLNSIYKPSEDVVAREVQGEFIIIPVTNGVGDLEDEIFTLNPVGLAVWNKLDGKKSLNKVVKDLILEFEGSSDEIEKDVLGFTGELLNRRMLVEAAK